MTTPQIRVTPDEANARMVAIRGQLDANKPQGQTLSPGGIDPRILTAVQDQTLISRQTITTASGTADNSAIAAQALGAQDRVNRSRILGTPTLRDTQSTNRKDAGPPKTLQDLMAPPDGKPGPTPPPPKNLDEALFPHGTPQPAPPRSLLDQTNAQRIAAGQAPLNSLRDDPQFMSTARSLLAKQGLSPAQIEQQIDATVKLSEQPLPTYKPPTPDTMGPATASLQRPFSDAYNDFMNRVSDSAEATVDGQVQAGKNLVGLGGPGAPGVADSWKDLAKGTATGMYEAATNPVGVATDQIKEFSNDPAAYIGKKMIEVPETLATLPLGGEGAALRTGLPGDLGDAASAGRMTETASGQLGDLAPASEHLPSVAAPVAHSPAVPPSLPEANVPRIPVVPESPPAHAVADMPGPRPALEGPIPQLADVPSQHIPEAPRTSELPHLSEAAAPLAARVPEPMTSSAAASIPDGIRASAAELAPSMASGVAHTPPIHPVEAPRSIESPQYGSGASGSGFHPPHDPPPPPHQGPDHPPSAHNPSPEPHPHADSPGDRPPAGDYHDADGQNAHHVGDDPGHHSSPWDQNVLSDDQRAEILAAEKGSRPDPSEYLPPEFIQHHLEKFSDGASRFTTSEALEDYGIGHRDGTSFVFPTRELDQLMTSTGGDRGALEAALGLPEGYLSTEGLVRVDIPDAGEYNVRVPSGNEAGANDQWIPGGFLPTGTSEAVIDGAKVPQDDLIITNMDGK